MRRKVKSESSSERMGRCSLTWECESETEEERNVREKTKSSAVEKRGAYERRESDQEVGSVRIRAEFEGEKRVRGAREEEKRARGERERGRGRARSL